jgi:phosphoribosyl 1,2-cyclic phosphodiesterase
MHHDIPKNTDPSVLAPPNRLHLCVLASGSRGNAVYIADEDRAVLIDAGLSGVEIERRMASRGLKPEGIGAIVVSHEHSDHIHGVGVLARRYGARVYMTKATHQASGDAMGKLPDLRHFQCGTGFTIGGLAIHPFTTSHDAVDPAGFTVSRNGLKIGVATDLGIPTALLRTHLADCNALVLEANHDPEMLDTGPYPWPLKQRIRSRSGHLSNEASGELLEALIHPGLTHVVLAHLSEQNNSPEKALAAIRRLLGGHRIHLSVAAQDRCTDLFTI